MTQTLEEIRDSLNTMTIGADAAPLRNLVFELCERVIDLEYRLGKAEEVAQSTVSLAYRALPPEERP